MKSKMGPWVPAIFCSVLSVITLVANLVGQFLTGAVQSGLLTLICFLPLCFLFVGAQLAQLQKERDDLQRQLDELKSQRSTSLHQAA